MKREFAQRNAAFLADVADHRKLGLAVDGAVLERLAKLHDVPVPALDQDDDFIRRERNKLDRLTTRTALERARVERTRLDIESGAAAIRFLNTASGRKVPARAVAALAAKHGLLSPRRVGKKWVIA